MAAAALALIVANSPLATAYFEALHVYVGPLTLQHWINDGLMGVSSCSSGWRSSVRFWTASSPHGAAASCPE